MPSDVGLSPARPERVADNVWLVRAPLPSGFVCLYVVRGYRLALIDTGFAMHPGEVLAPSLEALGLHLEDVDVVLNTHGHPDHLGGNASVKDISGAEVCIHGQDAHLAAGPTAHFSSFTDPIVTMRHLGLDADADAREAFLLERVGRDVGVNRALDDGDRIDLGNGVTLRVIHTPGHTRGSVTYLLEGREIAFTGDSVQGLGAAPAGFPLYFDPDAYLASLSRVQALAAEVLCLGHPFKCRAGGATPIYDRVAAGDLFEDSRAFVLALAHATETWRGDYAPSLEAAIRHTVLVAEQFIDWWPAEADAFNATVASTVAAHLGRLESTKLGGQSIHARS